MATALVAQKCTLGRHYKAGSIVSKHLGRHEKFKVSFVPISILQLGHRRVIVVLEVAMRQVYGETLCSALSWMSSYAAILNHS